MEGKVRNGVEGTMNKDFGMTRLFRPFFIAFSRLFMNQLPW